LAEEIYNDFLKAVVKPAFDQMEKEFREEHDKNAEGKIPDFVQDKGWGYFTVYYTKGSDSESDLDILSRASDEEYEYRIEIEITRYPNILVHSEYVFTYPNDNKYRPHGFFSNVPDYRSISVDDICKDIRTGYMKMLSEGKQ